MKGVLWFLFVHVTFFWLGTTEQSLEQKEKPWKITGTFLDKSLQWTVNSPLWKLCDVLQQQSHRTLYIALDANRQSIYISRTLPFATWNKFWIHLSFKDISRFPTNLASENFRSGVSSISPTPTPTPPEETNLAVDPRPNLKPCNVESPYLLRNLKASG